MDQSEQSSSAVARHGQQSTARIPNGTLLSAAALALAILAMVLSITALVRKQKVAGDKLVVTGDVVARRFIVRGKADPVAVLGLDDADTSSIPALTFFDAAHAPRASFGAGVKGLDWTSFMTLCAANGEARVVLKVRNDGEVALQQWDAAHRTRIALGLSRDGEPFMYFYDQRDSMRVAVELRAEEGPLLKMLGPDGLARVLVLGAGGTGGIALANASNRVIWSAPPIP